MEGEILVIKKADLVEILDNFQEQISSKLSSSRKGSSENNNPKVKRLTTRQIKEMLGVGDTTFEKIQSELPLHRTKTGRLFGYEHDIIIYLFREHPPYFDYKRFSEYVSEEGLIKNLSGR